MNAGVYGAIIGSVIGIVGGILGTYFSIHNTDSERERSFITRCSIVCWIALAVFLAALFFAPAPYRMLVWVPYAPALGLGIWWTNKTQARIRREEAASQRSGASPSA